MCVFSIYIINIHNTHTYYVNKNLYFGCDREFTINLLTALVKRKHMTLSNEIKILPFPVNLVSYSDVLFSCGFLESLLRFIVMMLHDL